MTYTTQQLRGMSDFEVNKALAKKVMLDFKLETWTFDNNKDTVQFFNEETKKSRVVNYCNNPNDIMPLAFERGIKLDCVACPAGSGFVYYAKSYDGELQSDYDSACRAIACLLLMMDE